MELRERNPSPVSRNAVYFGEKKVGEIEETGRDGNGRFHVCLRVADTDYSCGLVQGHGETPEAAVRDAIMKSRADAQRYLVGLLDLEKDFLASV